MKMTRFFGWDSPRGTLSERARGQLMRQFDVQGTPPSDLESRTEMERVFWRHEGRTMRKWHHYLPIYDRYFSRFRGTPVRILEIGVGQGGSLALWRQYFGESAVVFGADIRPACAEFDGEAGKVRIGSQTDRAFLESIVAEMGGIDIVVDDGSHLAAHIMASLDVLFPVLSDNGVYLIEDLQTAYWRKFASRFRSGQNVLHAVDRMVDDMNHWYHRKPPQETATAGQLAGIHIHDAIVVLEKGRAVEPRHSRVGRVAQS